MKSVNEHMAGVILSYVFNMPDKFVEQLEESVAKELDVARKLKKSAGRFWFIGLLMCVISFLFMLTWTVDNEMPDDYEALRWQIRHYSEYYTAYKDGLLSQQVSGQNVIDVEKLIKDVFVPYDEYPREAFERKDRETTCGLVAGLLLMVGIFFIGWGCDQVDTEQTCEYLENLEKHIADAKKIVKERNENVGCT